MIKISNYQKPNNPKYIPQPKNGKKTEKQKFVDSIVKKKK